MDENISFYNAAAPHAVNEREDDTYILAIESSVQTRLRQPLCVTEETYFLI